VRWHILVRGRMPVTQTLDQPWYATPNIHLCTIRDFDMLCRELGLAIEKRITVNARGKDDAIQTSGWFANLFGEQAVYLLTRTSEGGRAPT
jgi:methionine biosynthesis protein MetW